MKSCNQQISTIWKRTKRVSIHSFLLVLLNIQVLLVAGCYADNVTTSRLNEDRNLAVYMASKTHDDVCTIQQACPDGEILFLAPTPLITRVDIAQASIGSHSRGGHEITLRLSNSGSESVQSQNDQLTGRYLVFVWDENVIYAPIVQPPLYSTLLISDDQFELSEETLQTIVDELND